MIPKLIHYCWISSDPVPGKLQEYMKSWKEKLPEYEFILWNRDRFDIESNRWVKEAVEAGKYAFAADYIRLYALYRYGGIYLDMDVEVIRTFDPFLHLNTMICYERDGVNHFEMAVIGVEKNSSWILKCLSYYDKRSFFANGRLDTKILPLVINEALSADFKIVPVKTIQKAAVVGAENEIRVLPHDFFSPKWYWSGRIHLTENTVCIHHFAGSWLPGYLKFEGRLWNLLGLPDFKVLERILLKIRVFRLINGKNVIRENLFDVAGEGPVFSLDGKASNGDCRKSAGSK